MAKLDKFYTKVEVANKCYNELVSLLDVSDRVFLEPSAGNGSFLNFLKKFEAYDLEPENDAIVKMDFFDFIPSIDNYITIGNPPFGKRCKLAIDFFNKASGFSDVIAFILPISFLKFGIQNKLNKDFKLLKNIELKEFSFLDREKEFDVNCVFQIWVKSGCSLDTIEKDLRIKEAPPIHIDNFELYQYNATEQSINTIDEDWDLCVFRQGYHDYNNFFFQKNKEYVRRCMTGEETGKKQQFFFIKAKNKEDLEKIILLDFNNLAARNLSTPGFGKADFVAYYMEKYGV